jgi:glycosyltransferase involved in cell wall biosynthesis
MPLVWRELPQARLLLAGADPKKRVKELEGDRVTVTGFVEDIRECYASAKILAAPMQSGSGLQNKLLEAMSMRIPCVTTSIANASLHAEVGKEVLVGDTAESFAAHVVSLLKDEQQRDALAQQGYDFVHRNFSWEKAGEKLEAVLKSVVKK